MNTNAINWWIISQGKVPNYSTRNNVITSWNVPGITQPTPVQIEQITKDYLNSKDYAKDIFSYTKCMEDLNVAFWNRMSVLAPIVGLIDLWMRWKNFGALKTKCLEWTADPDFNFEQQDFDLLNDVMKMQNIDLMQW